jgi:hypothetical protein
MLDDRCIVWGQLDQADNAYALVLWPVETYFDIALPEPDNAASTFDLSLKLTKSSGIASQWVQAHRDPGFCAGLELVLTTSAYIASSSTKWCCSRTPAQSSRRPARLSSSRGSWFSLRPLKMRMMQRLLRLVWHPVRGTWH